jgi:hypothetical protein
MIILHIVDEGDAGNGKSTNIFFKKTGNRLQSNYSIFTTILE